MALFCGMAIGIKWEAKAAYFYFIICELYSHLSTYEQQAHSYKIVKFKSKLKWPLLERNAESHQSLILNGLNIINHL